MINTVALMGRLTYEPELKVTPSGLSVINLQIACDRKYQSNGEKLTDFIDCQAWKQTAEFISRYYHKGDMIALEGTIQTSNFTDKDGNKRKTVTVVVNNVSFCGSKQEKPDINIQGYSYSKPAPSYAAADSSNFEEIVDDDDDLPF